MSYNPEPEIQHYLQRLSSAARDLPNARRRELIGEIEQHIRQVLTQTPCTNRDEMLSLLAHVGDAAEIAAAAYDDGDAGNERRSLALARLRRRPLRVIVGVGMLVLVGLAIASAAWIQTYQPLSYSGPSRVVGRVSVAFHPGFRFRIGASVQNKGRFTVRVLGVPYAAGSLSGRLVSAQVMMSRDIGGARLQRLPGLPSPVHFIKWPAGPYEPFRPFDLKPGQVRSILLVGVYGNCSDARKLVPIGVPDVPVRFRFLWKTETARIPLPKEHEIIPPSGGCPSAIALSHRLNANKPAGQTRVFEAGTIKPGVRIFCAGHEARASTLVPTPGDSAMGAADGPDGRATIRLTTRSNGSVVAHCTSGDLPAAAESS